MLASTLLSSLMAASATVQAAPFFASRPPPKALAKRAEPKTWQSHVSDVQIHESCNASQSAYLRNGLDDMERIAEHAHDRILTLGEQDPLYVKYFGNASSAAASGLYAQIVWGNKPGVLLRCDNPDGNCAEQTSAGPWAGHWRGQNATEETVICEPSYANRLHLASLCWDGNEIGVTPASQWLAADLLHRLMHIPSVTYNHVEHAADTYPDVLALAASNSSLAAYNQATFQLYALDAYAQDVAFPPSGCVGAEAHIPTEEDDGHSHSHDAGASSSSSAAPAASATVPAEMTIGSAEASATASAAESCHTHGDGEVHCS